MPSCRRRNFPERFDGFEFSDEEDEDDDEDKKNDGKVDPALGLGAAGSGAKMMGNSLATDGKDKNFWIFINLNRSKIKVIISLNGLGVRFKV